MSGELFSPTIVVEHPRQIRDIQECWTPELLQDRAVNEGLVCATVGVVDSSNWGVKRAGEGCRALEALQDRPVSAVVVSILQTW
jgi:hypothetical protein